MSGIDEEAKAAIRSLLKNAAYADAQSAERYAAAALMAAQALQIKFSLLGPDEGSQLRGNATT